MLTAAQPTTIIATVTRWQCRAPVGIPGFQLNTTPKNSGEVHTRPLTAEETQLLFKKLSKCIGRNTKHLIDRLAVDAIYCFRLHKQFVCMIVRPRGDREEGHQCGRRGEPHLARDLLRHVHQVALVQFVDVLLKTGEFTSATSSASRTWPT